MTDEAGATCEPSSRAGPTTGWTRREALLLALVLAAAFYGIQLWVMYQLGLGRLIYDRFGSSVYQNCWHGVSLIMPLLLCLAAPGRSGLRLGMWRSRTLKVLGVCAVPPLLTAIVCPFTSKPFTGAPIAMWLISPIAQELFFTGYLYGFLDRVFPGPVSRRVPVNKAVFLTPVFFSLWHAPWFGSIATSYVIFMLVYTFVYGAWMLLARQWTGSILPGIVVHMMANFIAWKGW